MKPINEPLYSCVTKKQVRHNWCHSWCYNCHHSWCHSWHHNWCHSWCHNWRHNWCHNATVIGQKNVISDKGRLALLMWGMSWVTKGHWLCREYLLVSTPSCPHPTWTQHNKLFHLSRVFYFTFILSICITSPSISILAVCSNLQQL